MKLTNQIKKSATLKYAVLVALFFIMSIALIVFLSSFASASDDTSADQPTEALEETVDEEAAAELERLQDLQDIAMLQDKLQGFIDSLTDESTTALEYIRQNPNYIEVDENWFNAMPEAKWKYNDLFELRVSYIHISHPGTLEWYENEFMHVTFEDGTEFLNVCRIIYNGKNYGLVLEEENGEKVLKVARIYSDEKIATTTRW